MCGGLAGEASLASLSCNSCRDGVCSLLFTCFHNLPSLYAPSFDFNPRRACARVTVVVLCVCLSVCQSVTPLAASASIYTCDQRHPRIFRRL